MPNIRNIVVLSSVFQVLHSRQNLKPLATMVPPVLIWAVLWTGIFGGAIQDIYDSESLISTLRGYLSVAPLATAIVAGTFILYRAIFKECELSLFSPLGMAALYGFVGILATVEAPYPSDGWYWALIYLSVPTVLWATVQVPYPLEQLARLMDTTWLLILLIWGGLFIVGIVLMDLENIILSPSGFLKCEPAGHWFTVTSGHLRATGVGRYAAMAAIICLGALTSKRFAWAWSLLLVGTLMLLLTTHARGAIGGLAIAIATICLLYWGKKAALIGIIGTVMIIALYFTTNFGDSFLADCFGKRPVQSEAPVSLLPEHTSVESTEANLANPVSKTDITPEPLESLNKADLSPNSTSRPQVAREPTEAEQSSDTIPPIALNRKEHSTESDMAPKSLHSGEPTPDPMLRLPGVVKPTDAKRTTNGTSPLHTNQENQYNEPRLTPQSLPSENATPGPTPNRQHNQFERLIPSESASPTISTSQEPTETSPTIDRTPQIAFTLSGRQEVWAQGLVLISHSLWLGYGFHADRVLLNTHIHNAYLHATIQTGIVGLTFFVLSIIFAWVLLWKVARNLNILPSVHKRLVIQTGGILAFLTARGLPESSGAFFGVDWLVLALLMLYLEKVNRVASEFESHPNVKSEPTLD